MQHLLLMSLQGESPGYSEGGLQNKAMSYLNPLNEISEIVKKAASVWHEYCSDAVCPTLMDWQAR